MVGKVAPMILLDQIFGIDDLILWFICLAIFSMIQTTGSTRKRRKRQKEIAIQMSKSMKEGYRGISVTVKVEQ